MGSEEPRDHKFLERWWEQVESDPNIDEKNGLLVVALVISTKARRDGTHALLSNRRLAQILRRSEATVKRRTQRLQELGYLKRVERGGRRSDTMLAANVYDLTLPVQRLTQVSRWDDAPTAQTGAPTAQTGAPTAQTGAPTAHLGEPPSLFPL